MQIYERVLFVNPQIIIEEIVLLHYCMTHECSQQVQHGSGLHLQYPQYQLTPGLQVTGGGSLEVAGGIQIASGSGTPLQTAQILNTQLQSVPGTAFPSQLLLQTPQLGKLVSCMQPCLFAVCLL